MKYLALLVLASLATSCGDDDCCTEAHHDAAVDVMLGQDANASLTEVALVPVTINRDLDLLFVLDDSDGMRDKRAKLLDAFPSMVSTFLKAPGGLPSLHVGVISTDLGTKGADDPSPGPAIAAASCSDVGKDGVLQTNGASVTDLFISNLEAPDGSRLPNYTGALTDVFEQMATTTATGCAFEQPLEAIRRGLSQPANAGFLRASARLAIVLISDEDDCSFSHSSVLGADTTILGPLSSFRCTRFGVECELGGVDSDEMNMPGTKHLCHPAESSAFMTDVGRYVSFMMSLKVDPRDVLFTGIVAPPEPFNVISIMPPNSPPTSYIAPSCTYASPIGSETGMPAVRTTAFADRLPQGRSVDICDADFPKQMIAVAQRINGLVGAGCIQQQINQPSVCEAFDVDAEGHMTSVPRCGGSNALPCFDIVSDPNGCPAWQQLRAIVKHGPETSANTWTSVRCAV